MSKREISVTITFTEDDLQSILDGIWWGDDDTEINLQLEDLTGTQFGRLAILMQESAPWFHDELMAGMADAVANGWLDEFTEQFECEEA
jgi:hypothetical protein